MFRWIALAAVVGTLGISIAYRHTARRSGEVLARYGGGRATTALGRDRHPRHRQAVSSPPTTHSSSNRSSARRQGGSRSTAV